MSKQRQRRHAVIVAFNPRRRGFSLIELLVSMSVLALLVGIILPTLQHVILVEEPLLRCSNNLHQLYQAMTMYVQDADDALPMAGFNPLRDHDYPRLNLTLAKYGVGDMTCWICPADRRPESTVSRWGSMVYPVEKLRESMPGTRILFQQLGSEFPLLADRGPFHLINLPEQGPGDSETTPGSVRQDGIERNERKLSPFAAGYREGHNSLWANGKITIHARKGQKSATYRDP